MDVKKEIETLSLIEKKALKVLKEQEQTFQDIAEATGMNKDSTMRALFWLTEKGFAEMQENKIHAIGLSEQGKLALEKGLPEKRFVLALKELGGQASLKKITDKTGMGKEANIAFGKAKKNAWISLQKTEKGLMLELTGLEENLIKGEYAPEQILKKIADEKEFENTAQEIVKELAQRGLLEKRDAVERKFRIAKKGTQAKKFIGKIKDEINILTSKIIASKEWEEKAFRKYNIKDPCPPIFSGRKQPYIQFLSQIRRKLSELGFKEMFSPLIVQEFYNFDVLFQPQNHPARTWTDTYQLKQPTHGKLPDKKTIKSVKNAHETGGVSASAGWGYDWSEKIAAKLMPSAHATAHSARQITKGIEIPGKYFAIARCYRPDVLDATHLIEFNQMDGFIVGEDLNFRHLLGMLKRFAIEVAGAEKVKFYPDYYPFTEPSVQLSAKHPELGWIEFAGAGMFRPEMMENLGINQPAIAWGMGIDRLAMFKLGIKDIRYLFSDSLNWLRDQKLLEEI